jgi:hypothetical protein
MTDGKKDAERGGREFSIDDDVFARSCYGPAQRAQRARRGDTAGDWLWLGVAQCKTQPKSSLGLQLPAGLLNLVVAAPGLVLW